MPLDKEAREERALHRFGTDEPICICCEESDWRCLELHHLAGKDYAEDVAIVCRNCHRKLSDAQYDHLDPAADAVSQLEIIGRFLMGLADLFELLLERLRDYGAYLINLGREHAEPIT
ncbi:MAG: hypothetical protein CME85_14630 [Henriciella sp.]|uniref:hypothetical protein n=1 Tax=Henriciella sp. TaxID=1968823 RepID=UPI000C11BEE1|nr:hypothetical protein [Henriciella sp.]MBF34782.1 hypothetical protein [Hyphomonadaceae bacterium]MBK76703.1 hypothetical protein [Henriciella sp.]PHR82198.1 MAG: hypothetical protein COA64_02000 [Henriciella sp.]|tara:strand:- start:7006 stop:7359 length:354 start_codon:yes stop_codon:yes gene_type:complete